MEIQLKTKHYAGIGIGGFIILLDFILFFKWSSPIGPKGWYFNPIIVIGLMFAGIFFLLDFLAEGKRQKEIEEKFLEFVRALVEQVKSGISIPSAVKNVSKSDLGPLTPYVKKMSNQIEWGYSMNESLLIFANDTGNDVIKRSIGIVMQAQRSGGDIAAVLESISNAVMQIKRLKEEQKSGAYNQMVQGYIIFVIFIAIMLVMKIYLVPKLSEVGSEMASGLAGGLGGGGGKGASSQDLGNIFLATILIQGIFAGLMIGKFSEGKFQAGIKHSIGMVVGAYLLFSTVSGIFGADVKESLLFLIPTKEIIWRIKRCFSIKKV